MEDPQFGLGALILAIFASSGFWALVTAIVTHQLKSKDTCDAAHRRLSSMVLGLGHVKICERGEKYLHRGYITQDEFDDFMKYLYNPYVALGGDGTAELMVKKIQELPLKPTAVSITPMN